MPSLKKDFACISWGENDSLEQVRPACLLRRIEGKQKWASGNAVGFFHGHKVSS